MTDMQVGETFNLGDERRIVTRVMVHRTGDGSVIADPWISHRTLTGDNPTIDLQSSLVPKASARIPLPA